MAFMISCLSDGNVNGEAALKTSLTFPQKIKPGWGEVDLWY
jgi:hypothetical protein